MQISNKDHFKTLLDEHYRQCLILFEYMYNVQIASHCNSENSLLLSECHNLRSKWVKNVIDFRNQSFTFIISSNKKVFKLGD